MDFIFKEITKKEWRFVFLVSTLVILATIFPYLYGFMSSTDVFLWSNYTNFSDTTVYLSLINQVQDGGIFFENLFTSEFSYSYSFRPLFLVLGLFAKITGLSNVFVLLLAKILIGYALLFFLYYFLYYFLKNEFARKVCFLLLSFGSGFGFLFSQPIHLLISNLDHELLFKTIPMDLHVLEANLFSSIFSSPITPLALLILLVVFYWFINSLIKLKWTNILIIYFLIVLLGFIHPFELIALFAVCSFFVLIIFLKQILLSRREIFLKLYLFKFLVILIAIATSAGYYFLLINFDPSFLSWSNQNITESPPFTSVILGYGLIFLLATFSLILVNLKNNKVIFLVSWIVILFFFSYIPFHFQRRLLISIFIPLCVLASVSLTFFLSYLFRIFKNKFFQEFFISLIILIFSMSNILVVWSNIVMYSQKRESPINFYLPLEYYQSISWFGSRQAVVLASPFISNTIPAFSVNKVYVGHVIQSSNFSTRYRNVKEWFFANNQDDQNKKIWLNHEMIDYVMYGSFEKQLGDFDPSQKDYLQEIYSKNGVAIYKVL